MPLCAKCGKHMRHAGPDASKEGRIILTYGRLPGSPSVGWHERCIGRDKRLWNKFCADLRKDGSQVDALALLKAIDDRGPGRLGRGV